MRPGAGEVGDDAHLAVGCVVRAQPGRAAHPGVASVGTDQQSGRQRAAVGERQHGGVGAQVEGLRRGRAEQRQVALALDVLPQLAGHQRGFEYPAEFVDAGFVGGEVEARAGVAVYLHGVDRRDAPGVKVLPGADLAQEVGVGRADRVDAGVPTGRAGRRVIFDEGDSEAGIAQRAGQREAGEAAADDGDIKLHGKTP